MLLLLFIAALFVAYANGANDDFKGVATLYGGRVLSYQRALQWGILTTFAGSLISFLLSGKLLSAFSGKGIVSASVLQHPTFIISVALAAALTVFLAALLGFPISTTHSLVGALMGAGIASGGLTSLIPAVKLFFVPLIAGPIVAMAAAATLYAVFHATRLKMGIENNFCLCVGDREEVLAGTPGLYMIRSSGVQISLQEEQHCRMIYSSTFAGINLRKFMDGIHLLSAGAVSLARGLNDTPKIAALLLMTPALPPRLGVLSIAIAMAVGGAIHSRKIAQKMSFDITEMNPGQAFTGNFVTAILVITGSLLGVPLSTTHVSCSSIFGIGAVNRSANWHSVLQIITAWLVTLPVSVLLAMVLWQLLSRIYS